MNYKQIIDGLAWNRTAEEIELGAALRSAERRDDLEALKELFPRFQQIKTEPPLRQAGLEKPVFYAVQARSEWEMLGLADEMGERVKDEYELYPAGQSGIGLNWNRLSRRIWVPDDYLNSRSILPHTRAIFSQDEANAIGIFDVSPEDLELRTKVLYGPDAQGSSDAKIEALLTDSAWRAFARAYSLRLLDNAGQRYTEFVQQEFRPVLAALISAYSSEMR